MKKLVAAIEKWWLTKVQSHVSALLMALALVDLTGYEKDITAVVGARGYALIRIIGLGAIFWRALQVRVGPPSDQAPPNV